MGVIFDLDNTLIDSSIADEYRASCKWTAVYGLIPSFSLYEGIDEVLDMLVSRKISICIVTSSPKRYCQKVVSYWKIPFDQMVCYHDTTLRKPHPEPIVKALQLLNLPANRVLSLGDRDIDIIASKAADVKSVACLWGAADRDSLIKSSPNFICNDPIDLHDVFDSFFR